ncbi:MAG: hypothetical protein K9J13_13730 [Saprospiraceae bacterium]|nr:hypothetical protein [Saprospiraceae bacterium]
MIFRDSFFNVPDGMNVFFISLATIISIPSLILHINYFENDFRKKVNFDLKNRELTIDQKHRTTILFNEITKIDQYVSFFGRYWNIAVFMGNEYNYYKIYTKNKGIFIITCLTIMSQSKIPLCVTEKIDIYPLIKNK